MDDQTPKELAKAVQAMAPILDKAVDRVSGFLHKVMGQSLEHVGGVISDWAKYFRYTNMLKIADRVDTIHAQREIVDKTIPIPPRLAVPLLERASLEDDDTLVEMWAGLIANATDPRTHVQARRSFIQLLSSLEPVDALVLKEIERCEGAYPNRLDEIPDDDVANEPGNEWRAMWPNVDSIAATLGVDRLVIKLALENIERLGLAYDYMPLDMIQGYGVPVPLSHDKAMIELSTTGRALLTACNVNYE